MKPVRVDPAHLVPGTVLEHDLFSASGVKLLGTGAELSPELCRMIKRAHRSGVYLAKRSSDVRMWGEDAQPLGIGKQSSAYVVSKGGYPLVERGQEVEPHHHAAWRYGAYSGDSTRDLMRDLARVAKLADTYTSNRWDRWAALAKRIDPVPGNLQDTHEADFLEWPDLDDLRQSRKELVESHTKLLGKLVAGQRVHTKEVLEIVEPLMDRSMDHPEHFCQLALLERTSDDYLGEHAVASTVLAIATAYRMSWSKDDVRLAGLSALLADIGMTFVPKAVRTSDKPLDEYQINKVFRHPMFSVTLMDQIVGLPEIVRVAAYQHHERENGAGYPRGTKAKDICDLAKVVSVCDAFAAASAQRPYRVSRRPYTVIEELIRMGAEGMYHRRTVRALVESVGLFPVGSYVMLTDARLAVVLSTNFAEIDRPTVAPIEVVEAEEGEEPHVMAGSPIDLAEYSPGDLSVVRDVDPPGLRAPGSQRPPLRHAA